MQEVPDERHRVEVGERSWQHGEPAPPVDVQLDARVAGDAGLRDEEAGEDGILDPRRHVGVGAVVPVLDARDQPPRLIDLAKREQPVDRMEPVRVLVALGPQRADEERESLDLPTRLVEQVRRPGRDRGVVGEGPQERLLGDVPAAGILAVHGQDADHPAVVEDERNGDEGAEGLAGEELVVGREALVREHVVDGDDRSVAAATPEMPLPTSSGSPAFSCSRNSLRRPCCPATVIRVPDSDARRMIAAACAPT